MFLVTIKNSRKKNQKITFKQILQRLAKAHAQIKACNVSDDLQNQIWKIIYSLYQSKEIKKIDINLINFIKIKTIFINSKNKTKKQDFQSKKTSA